MAGMLRYAKGIPTIPVARRMNLPDLVDARSRMGQAPSWSAMFIRAYGLVCARFAPLRRSWISWPTPHLYEHPHSECILAVEREVHGEPVVLPGKIIRPEIATLDEIQQQLQHFQKAEVKSIKSFLLSLRFGRLPGFLQRLILWHNLDLSGKRRVKYIGTFGMSNYGMFGAESLHPIGLQTTLMTLGPISSTGEITVKLVYDHRVLDGAFVARCLKHLEEVLQTIILGELRQTSRLAG
jgi:hypothetical protein